MTNLKQLFKLKPSAPVDVAATSTPQTPSPSLHLDGIAPHQDSKPRLTTYKTKGLIVAGACNGQLSALEPSLTSEIKTIKQHQAQDQARQEKYKQEQRNKIAEKEGELKAKDGLIQVCQDKINQFKQEILDLSERITYVKAHPEEFGAENIGKVYVWMGSILLTFLTLYLFIFYSSASYSAFFKSFGFDDDKVSQAIFDAKALSAAWEMGVTALFFILLIPFVFFGLGFLIHRFQEQGGWLGMVKSFAIIIITFIFDAILAYGITKEIYEIKRGGAFEELPPYSIPMALENINFWVIIFAGFLVYLIWGFVFDFTIKAYQELDKWRLEQKKLKEQIVNKETLIAKEQEQINEHKTEKAAISGEIERLKASLTIVHIDMIDLANELSNFFDGWMIFVANHTPQDLDAHRMIYNEVKQREGIA